MAAPARVNRARLVGRVERRARLGRAAGTRRSCPRPDARAAQRPPPASGHDARPELPADPAGASPREKLGQPQAVALTRQRAPGALGSAQRARQLAQVGNGHVDRAARPVAAARSRTAVRADLPAAGAWLLAFAPVLYLGVRGGGYDAVVRGEIGIAVWWLLAAGALAGVLRSSGPVEPRSPSPSSGRVASSSGAARCTRPMRCAASCAIGYARAAPRARRHAGAARRSSHGFEGSGNPGRLCKHEPRQPQVGGSRTAMTSRPSIPAKSAGLHV